MNRRRVLEVRDLSVKIGGEPVLAEVSFDLARGEVAAVVGPNGSGKTTLFRALLGLVPHAGTVRWLPGTTLGYVPQRFTVPAALPMTVTEFFLLQARRFWFPEKAFLRHLSHELTLLDLPESTLSLPLVALSSGQIQRLLISWALLEHPRAVLFDEPTASVDAGFSQTVYAIMRRLARERDVAILLISHDLNVVSAYADRVLCLNRHILCDGPPAQVLTPGELERLFGVHDHHGAGH